jgi:predicted metal-dependent hydrolase
LVPSVQPRRFDAAPPSIVLASGEVRLLVRESTRARRLALRIDAAGEAVELVLPRRVSLATGLAFLDSRRDWVSERFALLPDHIPFADGAVVPVFGAPHRIRHIGLRRRGDRRSVAIVDGEIHVIADPAHVARRIRDHLIGLARLEIARRARALAARIGRRIARITLRDTTSRWGSCTASGNLAFSWRLVLAPEAVLDYVVAHEVAHLAEMNHGPRFWRLVESLAPDAAGQRAWLSDNRARLLRYG